MNKLFICATYRVGTHLLCRALHRAGIGQSSAMEYFNPAIIEHLGYDSNAVRDHVDVRKAYFAELERRIGDRPFACVVHWDQCETYLTNPQGEAFLKGSRFVYMLRDDTWAQAVSYHVAVETGCWDGESIKLPLSRYPTLMRKDLVAQRQATLVLQAQEWGHWFATRGISPRYLSYEKLVADVPAAVRLAAHEIGFSVPKDFQYQEQAPKRASDQARDLLKSLGH